MLIKAILKKPIVALILIIAVVASLSINIQYINIDASPDSLLLDSDPDLEFYREVHREYGSDEYIIVGFQPTKDLYQQETIEFIQKLTEELKTAPGISGVNSITNVPLLQQSRSKGEDGVSAFQNLINPNVDIASAAEEFATSPIYSSNLVSLDTKSTAIKVDIQKNQELVSLIQQKYILLDQLDDSANHENQALENQLDDINSNIPIQRAIINQRYKDALEDIRLTISNYDDQGKFYLAGAPLIANDIKTFINNDVRVFGISMIAIMFIVLFLFFRRLSWVLLSLVCAFLNVLMVSGLIGLFGLQLTIISSNFVALLIIFSITLSIHVIIRYQEVSSKNPDDLDNNLANAVKQIATPCIYMVATSAIAFISLIVSDIQPVIFFGLIMVMGLLCAFLLTFTVLPILIHLFKPIVNTSQSKNSSSILNDILNVIRQSKPVMASSIFLIAAISIYGITQITVENRFIDYFKADTEIYQGLIFIDQELGGTVPLEILLEAPEKNIDDNEELEEDDEFADYLEEEEDSFTQQSYWYNRRGINKVKTVHDYLESLDQVGKVLSISSTEKVFRQLAKGEELEDFHLALIHKKVPENIKDVLINPYISKQGNQARIVARIKDSDHTLIRNDLLNKIDSDINANLISNGESIRLSGISVLYNNVLQSLYQSQILTLGTVFICILIMLLILFRSFSLAVIGTLPNIFTAFFILGAMGLLKIPLDIMTITIAAITIGIGVDYAIHYIHRFKKEINNGANYQQAIGTVQLTVGKALYYTSITVTLGFIILVTSSFKPSIYFGLFTSIAMIVSLLATFTIIPLLINWIKPIKLT
ncbi:MAG: MMPL family transporter [Gammaproteobacteria bacterium]|nr:MMPL family transporter [Gammaproteobacteria bacterium]